MVCGKEFHPDSRSGRSVTILRDDRASDGFCCFQDKNDIMEIAIGGTHAPSGIAFPGSCWIKGSDGDGRRANTFHQEEAVGISNCNLAVDINFDSGNRIKLPGDGFNQGRAGYHAAPDGYRHAGPFGIVDQRMNDRIAPSQARDW